MNIREALRIAIMHVWAQPQPGAAVSSKVKFLLDSITASLSELEYPKGTVWAGDLVSITWSPENQRITDIFIGACVVYSQTHLPSETPIVPGPWWDRIVPHAANMLSEKAEASRAARREAARSDEERLVIAMDTIYTWRPPED